MSTLVRPYDYLLDGAIGWTDTDSLGVDVGEKLTLRRRQESADGAIETPAGVVDRWRPRGVVALRDAVYVADSTRGIVWSWVPCCPPRALPEIGARAGGGRRIDHPSALAVRNESDLLVLDENAGTVHVFALPDLALRRIVEPSIRTRPPHPGGDWEPIDLVVAPDHAVLVLDRRRHVWRLDFQLRVDRYYAGSLPEAMTPMRLAVDGDGFAYVGGADGGVQMLDPLGRLVPGPTDLDERSERWVADHHPPAATDGLGSDALAERHRARLHEARRALLPDDLSRRLERLTDLSALEVDWGPAFRDVLAPFIAERLGPPHLSADRDGNVSLTVPHPAGSTCVCAPLDTRMVVDATGALRLGDAALGHVLKLLIGDDGLTVMGSTPIGGIIGLLIDEIGIAGSTHLDAVFDRAGRRAALDSLAETLTTVRAESGPVDEPSSAVPPCDEPNLLVEPVRSLHRWLHATSITELVQAVVVAAVIDADGLAVLGPDAIDDLTALAGALVTGGPELTAPPDLRPFVRDGVVQFAPLDSGVLGNAWHRIVIEQNLPQRTSAQLVAFTSDVDRPDVSAVPLLETPEQHPWISARLNADEWLVQSPPGRFLHLALVLRGTDDLTPGISSISVYGTRASSLKFLPSVYVDDPESARTLDRLLSLTDTIFDELGTVVADFPSQLGPASADPEFLPWLASWFDLDFDPSWTEAQRRQILAEIVELYRWRGTRKGLTRLLELHTGLEGGLPRLVENRCARARPDFGAWVGSNDPCAFTVFLPADAMESDTQVGAIDRLLRQHIPAHTTFCLRPVLPGVELGDGVRPGSVVGFDTVVGKARHWRLPDQIAGWRGSPLHRALPDDSVPGSRGIRVGGPGHASRSSHSLICSLQEDRT